VRDIMETALLNEEDKTNAKHVAAQRVRLCETRLEAHRKNLVVDGNEQVEQEVRACEDNLAKLHKELEVADAELHAARLDIDRLRALYLSTSVDEDQSSREQGG
jgi:hypothetical protein